LNDRVSRAGFTLHFIAWLHNHGALIAQITMDSSADNIKTLTKVWADFLRALKSPQPFNPYDWIFRLSRAGLGDLLRRLGVSSNDYKHQILPLIPIFAISLISLCALAYPLSIRAVIKERWCCPTVSPSATNADCLVEPCAWMYLHDLLVIYLPGMILYHFLNACRSSPGVALARNAPREWKACRAQGGFAGWNTKLDPAAEERRVALYGPLTLPTKDKGKDVDIRVFPSPFSSYCDKCDILRPPRAHHCSTSNRCVLQFDHFCIWLNNSVGYNN
jgi:hypothetical protein